MQTPLLVKIFIVAALLGILVSLGLALKRLITDRGESTRTVRALTWRIGLSIALFLLLILGIATGVIVPHGVVP
ncbi:MAG: twin transmembrane helix small protein [Gammaproteobacteria bacterium]|nr:twin transmembrane helix small protein [Gammaproteobacteria bacterium]